MCFYHSHIVDKLRVKLPCLIDINYSLIVERHLFVRDSASEILDLIFSTVTLCVLFYPIFKNVEILLSGPAFSVQPNKRSQLSQIFQVKVKIRLLPQKQIQNFDFHIVSLEPSVAQKIILKIIGLE